MSLESPNRRFAVSSVNSTEGVNPYDKVGLLIMAEA